MTRVPFTPAELKYLDANDPKKFEEPKSYGTIARELNVLYNNGEQVRGRLSVLDYYRRKDEQGTVVRVISIPAEISRKLTSTQITRIIVSHCVPIGKDPGSVKCR